MRAATGPSGGVARISAAVVSAAPATAAAAADISIVAGSGLSGDRRSRLWFW